MNSENLIPNSKRTPEELRAMTRKGGIASGKARREKRTFRQIVAEILDRKTTNSKGETESNKFILMASLFNKAVKGDAKSTELLLKITGEITDKLEVTGKNGKSLTLLSDEDLQKRVAELESKFEK